jgi:hypothetical protein
MPDIDNATALLNHAGDNSDANATRRLTDLLTEMKSEFNGTQGP